MRVAVAGATGTAGTPIVAELERRGHEVRALSRSSASHPVDLLTGAGPRRGARRVRRPWSTRPTPARRRAPRGRCSSMATAGCSPPRGERRRRPSRLPLDRRDRRRSHRLLPGQGRAGGRRAPAPVPWSIVRATQFHELVAAAFASLARVRVLPRVARAPAAGRSVRGRRLRRRRRRGRSRGRRRYDVDRRARGPGRSASWRRPGSGQPGSRAAPLARAAARRAPAAACGRAGSPIRIRTGGARSPSSAGSTAGDRAPPERRSGERQRRAQRPLGARKRADRDAEPAHALAQLVRLQEAEREPHVGAVAVGPGMVAPPGTKLTPCWTASP